MEANSSVATKPSTKAGPPAVVKPFTSIGMGAGIEAKDVLIPKLLIMQPISDLVTKEKAKAGDILRSTTGEALGGRGKPVSFIPLSLSKVWVIFEKQGNSPKFLRTEPHTAENAGRLWEWTEAGKKYEANQAINLYALLPADVLREEGAIAKLAKTGELPDPDDALLPVLLQFTRTSYPTGKEVVTHFAKAESFGMPAAVSVLAVDTERVEGDKGTYYIYKLTKTGKTTPAGLAAARKWFELIAKSAPKVDDSDLGGQEPVAAKPLGKSDF